jgi:inactivated superfamily I helicase
VLELDGENIIAPQTLTWMAEHRNDPVEAKRWLGRLLEVHPTNVEAQLVQQRLDEFQEAPAKRRRMRSGG